MASRSGASIQVAFAGGIAWLTPDWMKICCAARATSASVSSTTPFGAWVMPSQ